MGLHSREWVAVIIISAFITSVFLTSHFLGALSKKALVLQKMQYDQALIEINVSGAVISPGVYKVVPGISLKHVLMQAGLSSKADKKKINLHKKIFSSCVVDVPEKHPGTNRKLGSKKKMSQTQLK
ncbi:MAG: hypothetical protein NT065_06915 [Chlamydiae bacterium]|nr:hypothetical protein [Chlamydiota bacterium]